MMFAKNKEESSGIIPYAKSVLTYTLFSETDQNNEYDLIWNSNGFVFIPIYPITYVIDEAFYNRLFTILNLALTPQYTLIRPLTMQVITLGDRQPNQARGLLIPARIGKPQRLQGTITNLARLTDDTTSIPIMDILSWNYVRSPHAVITGVSGSGKSYFLKYLFSICSKIGDIVAIDPKGSDLARLAKRKGKRIIMPEFLDNNEGNNSIGGKFLQDVINSLREVEETMYQRQSELYQSTLRISTDYRELNVKPIFIFMDELAALLTGASKKVKEDFQNLLVRLTVLGRESGVYLILSMQSARAEYIPTIVRDSISLRVQLGRINSENTKFLFPELSEMPMVPLGGKGSGIISIAGDERYAGIEPVLTPTIID